MNYIPRHRAMTWNIIHRGGSKLCKPRFNQKVSFGLQQRRCFSWVLQPTADPSNVRQGRAAYFPAVYQQHAFVGVMDLFSLGAAGDLGPDAQCIADWVLQSFSLTCSANEWKPQTGAPATHEESNSQTWYSTDG